MQWKTIFVPRRGNITASLCFQRGVGPPGFYSFWELPSTNRFRGVLPEICALIAVTVLICFASAVWIYVEPRVATHMTPAQLQEDLIFTIWKIGCCHSPEFCALTRGPVIYPPGSVPMCPMSFKCCDSITIFLALQFQ